jgi:hypothetical protein
MLTMVPEWQVTRSRTGCRLLDHLRFRLACWSPASRFQILLTPMRAVAIQEHRAEWHRKPIAVHSSLNL